LTHFLLLARGETVGSAEIVAISANKNLVDKFLHELADEAEDPAEEWDHEERDHRAQLTVVRGDDG
jgi:hypothetical protein